MSVQETPKLFGLPVGLIVSGTGVGLSLLKDKAISGWGELLTWGGLALYGLTDILPIFYKPGVTPPPTTCPTGQHLVNGACVPDTICTAPMVLVNGVCMNPTPPTCNPPYILQNNICVNPNPLPGPGPTPGPTPTGTVVTTLAGLPAAVANAAAGEVVVLQDGVYDNPSRMTLSGRAGVTIAAGRRGSTQIRGAPIDLVSAGLTFTGFDLAYNTGGDYVFLRANNCRFTRNFCHFANTDLQQEWLTVYGNNCLVDHNEFAGKTNHGTCTLIGTGTALYTGCRILYNSYHDRPILSTPAEAIRIGSSQAAWLDFQAEVAYNRFEKIDGETELCTFKGSGINCHHNTAVNCNSSFTFRHGNSNKFNDNVLINAGFRMYGHWHEVMRNQISEDSHNQLRGHIVMGGGTDLDDAGSPGVPGASNERHSQVKGCTIGQNIIMAGAATALTIFEMGDGIAPYMPVSNSIEANIITGSRGVLARAAQGADWSQNTVRNNILFPTGTAIIGDMPQSGFMLQDPLVLKAADNTYQFVDNSPLKWNQSVVYLTTAMVGINAP